MLPVEINDLIKRDVIGQKEALRFVSRPGSMGA